MFDDGDGSVKDRSVEEMSIDRASAGDRAEDADRTATVEARARGIETLQCGANAG
jgi:hypothetical protein